MSKVKIEIKHWINGSVLFEYEKENNTVNDTVLEAIKSSANLRSADLRSANLSSADLSSANLRFADLSSADLRYADLSSANLRFADLSSANLRFADLSSADLRYAKGIIGAYDFSSLTILKSQKHPLTAYKHVTDDFQSPTNNKKLTYAIGTTVEEKDCDTNILELCGKGLNVATLEWCLRDTNLDKDRTYIEVEFDPKDIVAIPFGTDGKFRVSKLKVIRKVPKTEINKLLKSL